MSTPARPCGPRFSPLGRWAAVGGPAVQAQLRPAFTGWGRPGALRVDNGTPWASSGELPTDLALWLLGLDVPLCYNPARQPQCNGVVERMQGVGVAWGEPHTCHSPEELQQRFERMDHIQRAEEPDRDGRSRLEVYPELAHSGRRYSAAWERRHWSLERVTAALAGIVARRRVDCKGSITLYNRSYYVGVKQRGQTVLVLFDPEAREW